MKKLLVFIACAYGTTINAMEVNEQSARAFVAHKGIKQLIMNPPIVRCIGNLDAEFLTADQRSELAQLAHKEWQERYNASWVAAIKATAEHKMDSSLFEAEHQIENLNLITKMLEVPANPTNN